MPNIIRPIKDHSKLNPQCINISLGQLTFNVPVNLYRKLFSK